MSLTAYMNLNLADVNVTPALLWAYDINIALAQIDSHDHSTGKGTYVTPSGLNINVDLDFKLKSPFNIHSAIFENLIASPSTSYYYNSIQIVNGEMFFKDGSGNNVQITNSGTLNVTGTGSFSGMDATCAATYSTSTKYFTFTQSSGFAAGINCGDVAIRELAAGVTNAVLITSPHALAAAYALVLPSALPASTLPVKLSSGGYLSTAQVLTADIADANVTRAKLEAVGQQISSSSGNFYTSSTSDVDVTNLSVTITTTGRPIMVGIISDGSASPLKMDGTCNGHSIYVWHKIFRDASLIAYFETENEVTANGTSFMSIGASGSRLHIDVVAAGTYTYKVKMRVSAGNGYCAYAKLIAYEL